MIHPSEPPTTYAVIGGGPFGLLAARALRRAGIDFEILERHTAFGGIWDLDNPGSPMYESCHFITSKQLGGYLDFPMGEDVPTYPSRQQVLDYILEFAEAHDFAAGTRFGAEVVRAEPQGEGDGTWWLVTTSDGEERAYRGLFVATGQQWLPFVPAIEGADVFGGEIYHSSRYRSTEQFAGRRVLVVGAGNSGVDIACAAAEYADDAIISTRRDYHWFPKQVFGKPTPDLFTGKAELPVLASLGRKPDRMETIALIMDAIGPMTAYGLPQPTDPIGSTQPIVSDLALHCLTHGLLERRPGVARLRPGGVEFVDGSTAEVDTIVLATGYDIAYPFLPEGAVDMAEGHPVFRHGTFGNVRGLYGIGTLHPSRADAWALFDEFTQLAVADARATLTGENADRMRELREEFEFDLKGDFPYLSTRRNANQAADAPIAAFLEIVSERFGVELPDTDRGGFYREPVAVAEARA